jgi:hypothetical protein
MRVNNSLISSISWEVSGKSHSGIFSGLCPVRFESAGYWSAI